MYCHFYDDQFKNNFSEINSSKKIYKEKNGKVLLRG